MRLIDADALINTLQELFYKRDKEARFTGDRGVTVTWNDAIYHIKTAPTIEERKTGKWIPVGESGCIIECSVCGKRMTALIDDNPSFCCHCGADMRGESNEAD